MSSQGSADCTVPFRASCAMHIDEPGHNSAFLLGAAQTASAVLTFESLLVSLQLIHAKLYFL